MKKSLLAAGAALATLVIVPVAAASPVSPALPARTLQLAVEVRHEHECLDAAQARMEQRHRRWADEARVTANGQVGEAHWALQLEHENVLDAHRGLVERQEWLMVREAEIRRNVRRAGSRPSTAQRRRAERDLRQLEREASEIEREHHALLEQHERISRQHDEIVDTYVARNSRPAGGVRTAVAAR